MLQGFVEGVDIRRRKRLRRRQYTIVRLRTALLWEMVFTLCLKLILELNFLRNPMVPTVFLKKVPNMLPRAPQAPPGEFGRKSH